ncbi:MAG: aminoacyl-tRNA hydrolase [Synergistaceae bacterium]|nr:aminoacyl-tRNA hydrolase [Synergistaceae bacterium]
MKLVAGLGNPGQEYVYTRHNMGWAVIDHWVRERSLGGPVSKFRGEFWRDRDFILLKPLTFMNLSGLAVREAVGFYKLEPSDVLVICDDIALPFGRLRLRGKGSAGGHNGLASVIACLGTLAVPRLRVGVGDSVSGNKINWVLGHLPGEEMKALPGLLADAAEGAEAWASLGLERAMSRVNAKDRERT